MYFYNKCEVTWQFYIFYQLYTIYLPVAENLLYPFITFSIASNRSFSEILFLFYLMANIPASVHTLLKSAPVVLGHNLF